MHCGIISFTAQWYAPKSVLGHTNVLSPVAENWGQFQKSMCTRCCFDLEEATSDTSGTTFAVRDPKLLSIFNLSQFPWKPL